AARTGLNVFLRCTRGRSAQRPRHGLTAADVSMPALARPPAPSPEAGEPDPDPHSVVASTARHDGGGALLPRRPSASLRGPSQGSRRMVLSRLRSSVWQRRWPWRPARGRRVGNLAPLLLEALEDRLALSTFVVTSTADAGPGSLRQAILSANAAP